ncbi:MAG: hypothetical protein J3R72DRAFT_423765 [Linnemannia gamsii]|nr:MAG: hypothetical protein J3R72DRAFT_423765 [Linnemannia gamsii]
MVRKTVVVVIIAVAEEAMESDGGDGVDSCGLLSDQSKRVKREGEARHEAERTDDKQEAEARESCNRGPFIGFGSEGCGHRSVAVVEIELRTTPLTVASSIAENTLDSHINRRSMAPTTHPYPKDSSRHHWPRCNSQRASHPSNQIECGRAGLTDQGKTSGLLG